MTPTYLLAVDPGQGSSGWALWKLERYQANPVGVATLLRRGLVRKQEGKPDGVMEVLDSMVPMHVEAKDGLSILPSTHLVIEDQWDGQAPILREGIENTIKVLHSKAGWMPRINASLRVLKTALADSLKGAHPGAVGKIRVNRAYWVALCASAGASWELVAPSRWIPPCTVNAPGDDADKRLKFMAGKCWPKLSLIQDENAAVMLGAWWVRERGGRVVVPKDVAGKGERG